MPETGEDSSEGDRGASPEKTSSPACLASETGFSGVEAEERRAAAWVRAARGGRGLGCGAGVLTERAFRIAGCIWGKTDNATATDGGLIDGAIDGINDKDGLNDIPEKFVIGNEPLILGSDGTKFGTAIDGEFAGSTTRAWANA